MNIAAVAVIYCPSCVKAARKGASVARINPDPGVYISRIKRIAPETASADINKLVTIVALGRTKSPKLVKSNVSQKTSIASTGMGTEEVLCSNINQRVWPILIAKPNACV